METIDDDVADRAVDYIKRQHQAGKPMFVWVNFTHMHFRTHPKLASIGQSGRFQSPYHDAMIDHDKNVGQILKALDDLGIADNTFVMYSTDNGPHINDDQQLTPMAYSRGRGETAAVSTLESARTPLNFGSRSATRIALRCRLPTRWAVGPRCSNVSGPKGRLHVAIVRCLEAICLVGGRSSLSGYLLGSYRIATTPEPNSSRLTSFKSRRFDSPANNVGPWPASRGCITNSYSSIKPSSAKASGSFTPPTNSPLPDSRFSC